MEKTYTFNVVLPMTITFDRGYATANDFKSALRDEFRKIVEAMPDATQAEWTLAFIREHMVGGVDFVDSITNAGWDGKTFLQHSKERNAAYRADSARWRGMVTGANEG